MQWFVPPEQVHGRYQPDKSIEMISMQMADKNMPDPLKMNMQPSQRYLCTFAAINKKKFFTMTQQLRRWITFRGWSGRTAAEYGKVKWEHIAI